MTYVIDASVAAKWFLREDLRSEARRLLDGSVQLSAPDWIMLEIAHVAFKKWRDHEMEEEQARSMVQALPYYFARLHPAARLTDRALAIALALKHPVYDCLYLACAEMTESIVVTADKQLCESVRDTGFAPFVRHLQEIVS